MKVYKTKDFSRLFKSEAISDSQLCEAVMRAEKGIIDADLGKGLIKQRIPRENAGRSGGYRSLMAYKHGNITLFLYLFAKNEKENIEKKELEFWRLTAHNFLLLNEKSIKQAIADNYLTEIYCHV